MTSEMFLKLAALNLSHEQMAGVLEIVEAAEASEHRRHMLVDEERKEKARERWRRWKANKREANVGERESTTANADSTLTRVEGSSNNLETSGEDISPSLRSGDRAKERRKSRIVETWAPNETNIAYAKSRGLSEPEIAAEADKFRDHHLKTGARFLDWDAAWRTWCQRVREYAPRGTGPPSNKPRRASAIAAEQLRSMQSQKPDERTNENILELTADRRAAGTGWS